MSEEALLSPCCSRSSLGAVEGADWVPNSFSLPPSDPSTPRGSALSSPQARRFRTPEGCDWRLPAEVLANLDTNSVPGTPARRMESTIEEPALEEEGSKEEASRELRTKDDVANLMGLTVNQIRVKARESGCSDQEIMDCDDAVENKQALIELLLSRREQVKKEEPSLSEKCQPEKDMASTYPLDDTMAATSSEPCQEPEPKVGTSTAPPSIPARVLSPGRSFISSAGMSSGGNLDASTRHLSKQTDEKTNTTLVQGAVMHAATPLRGSATGTKQQQQHGNTSGRQHPSKCASSFPFSSRKGVNSQQGRVSNSAHARTNFMFNPSPRSLALGPPRGSERTRTSDRVPAKSPPPASFPFADRSRGAARQLSPQSLCRSPQRNSASVRMSAQSSPSVPQFCGSTNVMPGTNRGHVFPVPAVSRLATGMSTRDSSAAKPRNEVPQNPVDNLSRTTMSLRDSMGPPRSEVAQSQIDPLSRTLSLRSPPRSHSLGPSVHSFVAPAPHTSFVPPVVPTVRIGSFVAPPMSAAASYVAPPPNTPALARNSHATPAASQTLPCTSPILGSTSSRNFRSSSPDCALMAPPLPYTLQVGSIDRCFMASVPPPNIRCTSPTSRVTVPTLPKSSLGRTSPGPSFVAPPPLSQSAITRATSVDQFGAGQEGSWSRHLQVSPLSRNRAPTPIASCS